MTALAISHGQHGDEDRPQHVDQRSAAQEARVAGDHEEVERVGGDEDAEHRDRVAAALGIGVVQRVEDRAADQRERDVGQQVVEQVRAAHVAARAVDHRRGEAERGGGRRPEQRHRERQAGERPTDAEALGVEHEDVAAQHEQRDQPDERQRLPLVGAREVRGGADRHDQQHALGDRDQLAAARERGARPPRARRRHVSDRPVGVGRRAYDGQRPDDQRQPDDECQPDHHSEHGSAYPACCAIRPKP